MKYVIIGNSTAAVAGIEGIRSRDAEGEITVVSAENHHCYGRPLISYCLMGATDKARMAYRPADFYIKNNVKALLGIRATRIDKDKKRVELSNGKSLPFDKLLVATGSRPFIPPMDGLDKVQNRFSFMTLDDMESLEAALGADKRVLVVGAGLIGLKCVEGILKRVKSVTVVDMADRVLPAVLDAQGAAIIQKQLEGEGVRFILNDSVIRFESDAATLKNSGARIVFDILVVAVGVRPNTELVKEIGGEVNRGIAVDDGMQTSVNGIYAAGDCAEGTDSSIGAKRVLALLPNAYFQGRTAGVNMAGGDERLTNAIPMNAIGFFGSHVLSAGVYEGECIAHIAPSTYKKLYVKDGRLVGFILINDFLRAGIYTSLIRNKTPLSAVDMQLLADKPQLLAFSKEARAEKLTKQV